MINSHIPILKSFDELKFNLGKKTLIDFLKGNPNATIDRNNLEDLNSYGCMFKLDEEEIEFILDQLIKKVFIQIQEIRGGYKVLVRTLLGAKEIYQKKFTPKEFSSKNQIKTKFQENTKISETDKKIFQAFNFYLNTYNDEQKKAIISKSNSILCIAGAGSGKTTVLTKRIEFLIKFQSQNPKKILAITFTKKAKQEMQKRLNELGITQVLVETFNSFSERVLRKRGELLYGNNKVRVANYKDKIQLVNQTLNNLGIKFEMFYDDYFNKRQLKEKTKDELFFVFVNDIFSIIDFYKNLETDIKPFYELEAKSTQKRVAKIMHDVAKFVRQNIKTNNLRDFTDQILDTLNLYRKHSDVIPEFEHILIDEYQDLNQIQYELIKILKPKNIFAVGDPRQAIYGWRGSDIKFILDFPEHFKETEIISLKTNYRSKKNIISLFNNTINSMGLIDLKSAKTEDGEIHLIEQTSEMIERIFITEAIKNSTNKRNEIFILARTNRILNNYADHFNQQGIKFLIKSEEEYNNKREPSEDEVVLSTVHSIKGMEANEVYLVSANNLSFPNKVTDNFVISLVKEDNDYNKEAEELRLFYVALSRAKEKLVITYTGNYSKFITKEMLNLLQFKSKNKSLFDYAKIKENLDTSNPSVIKSMLKDWRVQKSNDFGGLPAYMIISNKSIDELAQHMPTSKISLQQINGLGDIKIAKYGDEILKIING